MTAVKASELRPGLVVFLDTRTLRDIGGASTNTLSTPATDFATQDARYFLVLEVDPVAAELLAAPLFGEPGPDKAPLDTELKSGFKASWVGEQSYYFDRQFWRIPIAAIERASRNDTSISGYRRRYAANRPEVLKEIVASCERVAQPWRPV